MGLKKNYNLTKQIAIIYSFQRQLSPCEGSKVVSSKGNMLRAEIKEKRLRERFLLLYSWHADVSCGRPLIFSPKSSFLLRMQSGPKALG